MKIFTFQKVVRYIPITIRKWVFSSFFPISRLIIENFGLKSICRRAMSSNEWWVTVRSKCHYVLMKELCWCFCFEGFSIKTRKKVWWGHSTMYSNLRMTCLLSRSIETKHYAKGKGITSTTFKIKRQFTDTCQSAILNLAHLKYMLSDRAHSKNLIAYSR